MKSRRLLLIWVSLLLFLCLPFCSAIGQRQIQSRRQNPPSEPPNPTNPVIHLKEGLEIQENIPMNSNTPVIFHYKADSPHRQQLIVTVRSPGREIIIYARRKKMSDYFDTIPNEETAEISSLENQHSIAGIASISVPPLVDPVETVVVLAVYFNDIQSKNISNTTFNILASSKITHLFTGTQYSGSIAKDHYAYFMVPIMRSEGTLLISLTNLDDEGDADLVISYGQNTRPTISDHQFASISHERTEIVEITNTDIWNSHSLSGTLVIGVYEKTTGSFSLAVAYEDQKITDLTPGIPVEMPLNRSSSANFRFFHESKTNIQIMLKTLSGELNLYMTSLNLTQNLAYNLPDTTHYKWQISHADSQAFINIPANDPEACVSCLYIVHIEAISSSRFSLAINEGNSFVTLQDGYPYSGELRPQDYAPFELRSSMQTEEAQLRVDAEETEIQILISNSPTINPTNYLLKETIPSNSKNHIIPLKKSQENETFYIVLYNPSNMNVSYNFTITMKSSNTIVLHSQSQQISINPYEKISLKHYSDNENGELRFDLYFTVPQSALKIVESALSQWQIIKGRYWEEETSEPGQEILFETSAPKIELSPVRVRQTLLIKSSKGKYVIEIFNPWEFAMKISTPQESMLQHSGENWQYSWGWVDAKRFTMLMTRVPAKWYFWLYSCDRPVDLKIEKGNKQTEIVTIPKGGNYLYKETIENKGIENRFRYVSVIESADDPRGWSLRVLMHSALVDDPKFWDYEVKNEENLKTSLSLNYQEGNSQVTVEFDPVEFKDPDPTDQVIYNIAICDFSFYELAEINFCNEERRTSLPNCQDSELKLSVNHKETITVKFENVRNREYFVMTKASVIHKEQTLRVVPYTLGLVNVKSSFSFNLLIGIGIMVVLLALRKKIEGFGRWCGQCYEKIKRKEKAE